MSEPMTDKRLGIVKAMAFHSDSSESLQNALAECIDEIHRLRAEVEHCKEKWKKRVVRTSEQKILIDRLKLEVEEAYERGKEAGKRSPTPPNY